MKNGLDAVCFMDVMCSKHSNLQGKLKTKTEGEPSAGIKTVATWVSALKTNMVYRLSVIHYAPGKYGPKNYITGFVPFWSLEALRSSAVIDLK